MKFTNDIEILENLLDDKEIIVPITGNDFDELRSKSKNNEKIIVMSKDSSETLFGMCNNGLLYRDEKPPGIARIPNYTNYTLSYKGYLTYKQYKWDKQSRKLAKKATESSVSAAKASKIALVVAGVGVIVAIVGVIISLIAKYNWF